MTTLPWEFHKMGNVLLSIFRFVYSDVKVFLHCMGSFGGCCLWSRMSNVNVDISVQQSLAIHHE